MKTFKDLKGLEGIDKLNECIPYVDEIFSDKKLFEEQGDATWGETSVAVYKAHTNSMNKIFEALGEVPETTLDILNATTEILQEIFANAELRSFFIGACKNMRSVLLSMANTKGAQSQDT